MRTLLTLVAAIAMAAPGIVQAAEPPCLTPAEFTSLSSYALPSMISGTTQRCSTVLPADAFLRRKGADLSNRYASLKTSAWPGAKAAFLKVSANGDNETASLIRGMPDSSLQPMADAFISGMVSQQLPTERCRAVDRLIGLLSPLPPENTAELIALAVGLGARSGKARFGSLTVCSA